MSEPVYQEVHKKVDLAFEDLGVQELKNIEHPIRLYRVTGPGLPRKSSRSTGGVNWMDALLHPSSVAPLLVGAYLLATALGLPPAGRMFPAYGAVLVGVGLGRVMRLRTGQPAFSSSRLAQGSCSRRYPAVGATGRRGG